MKDNSSGKNETSVKKESTTGTNKKEEKMSQGAANENSTGKQYTKSDYGVTEIKYNIKDIPSSVKYTGKVTASASWKDNNGFNILLITETKEKYKNSSNDVEYGSKELYGYQFLVNGDNAAELWKIQDFVKDCPEGIELFYVKGSLSITDINNDGIGESVFMYVVDCLGDVSPMGLKLMMHEGSNKYAIRGNTVVGSQGGDMKVDSSFESAPAGFLDHAKTQWKKYRKVN
jgi:hypothetical protein